MIPDDLKQTLQSRIAAVDHPRELVMDIIFLLQDRFGYLGDPLLEEVAALVGMTPLEVEEIATFYEFIYRKPVGRHVIHVCDGVVCWMHERHRLRADHGRRPVHPTAHLLPWILRPGSVHDDRPEALRSIDTRADRSDIGGVAVIGMEFINGNHLNRIFMAKHR